MAVFKFRNLKNGQATPIPPGEFVVGRADDAYVHLEDPSVSRRHAKIINNSSGFFVEDLGSVNGTATRGTFVTRRTSVNYGDEVYIGAVPFRIDPEIAGEPDATPSAGLRAIDRAYMRRDTEPLPKLAESLHIAEAAVPEKRSDREVGATPALRYQPPVSSSPEPVPAAPAKSIKGWLLLFFLAGLGAGLLLGLIFAKFFFEMGGRAAALP
ncbi:FHA domain-containing protein [Methylacidiphilales bacterium]|nr:FHA domain-containing protein [Candidatus Methylacidiphilales bacterium]